MEDKSLVQDLVATARRRCLTHLVVDQSAFALTIGMGGAILLLLFGTQILSWYWIGFLTVASLGAGLYCLRKSIPSPYKLAQRIDRRLNLADALSTAIYFSSPDAQGSEAIRQRQRTEAESIARGIDVRATVPFTRPRYTYPAVALAAVACGLFAVRYAVTGNLNLQPSLVKIALDTFFPQNQEIAKAKKARDRFKLPPLDKGDPDSPTTQTDQAPDSMLDANDAPDATTADAADNSKQAAKDGNQQDPAKDAQGENADKNDKSPSGNDSNQENGPQSDSKDGKQQQNAKQDSKQGSPNDNSSMMDKLKDAMSNMLNKMKPSQKDSQSQQQNQQNAQKGQQDKSAQKGQQSQKQNQSADADSQSEQSDSGDKNQSAEAKGSEKSSDKDASKDSKSGIGSADGDKSAREAEQAQAMGKISEIIGKRSQNVTGEVMVEVGSSKQQLKTPWAEKQTAHAEAGSEIHRDEVPLIYQQFVQQYFEEIRKAPAVTPKPDAKTTPKNPG